MREGWASAWGAMQTGFDTAWQAIQPALMAAWAWLQVALPAALGWLQSTWTAVWPAIQEATATAWEAIRTGLTAAWVWLQETLPGALTSLQQAWATAWPAIQEAFGTAWDAVRTGLVAAWAWLSVALPAALAWLQGAWDAAWPAMQAAWDAVWPTIQTAWTTAQTWLETTLPTALSALRTAWDTAWPGMQEAVSTAWQAIQPALTAAWAWLQVALPVALGWLRSVWEAAWPAMQTAWDAVWTPLSTAWSAVKAWLDTTLPAALTALQTAWETGWPALQTAATTAVDAIKGTLDNLKSAFTSLQTGAGQAQGTLGGFWAQVTAIGAVVAAFFAPAIERLQAAFTALPEKLAPLMPKLQELGGAFGGLFQALQPFVLLVGAALAIAVDFGINRLTTVFNTLPGILGPVIDQITATIKLITVILTETVTAVKAVIDGDWATVWESAKTIAGEFSTFFRGLFSRLGTFMMAVAINMTQPVIDTLRDLGVDVDPILNGIKKTFETIWGGIQSAIQAVIDIVGKVTEAIAAFKDFLGGLELPNPFAPLVDAWNTISGGLGKLGTPGGLDGDPNTPLAGGTSYFAGGGAQLWERGYEQVVLPAGARVLTNGQTNNLPTGESKTVNINLGGVTVRSETDARRLVDMLRDNLVMVGA
jgi:phage-related protein